MRIILFIFTFLCFTQVSFAVLPDEILQNPQLEFRAREISKKIRCLVCQNENIDDSNAALAHDLRLLVRERLTKGDTDAEVVNFLVARYGEFVLLQPRFNKATYVLWLTPFMIIIVVSLVLYWKYKRKKHLNNNALTEEERQKLAAILKDNG